MLVLLHNVSCILHNFSCLIHKLSITSYIEIQKKMGAACKSCVKPVLSDEDMAFLKRHTRYEEETIRQTKKIIIRMFNELFTNIGSK